MFEVKKGETEVKLSKWNDCVNFRKLTRHFKAIYQQSRSTKINYLRTLILMLSVQAGLHKMLEVKREETEVKLSKWTIV